MTYRSPEDARRCIEQVHGREWDGELTSVLRPACVHTACLQCSIAVAELWFVSLGKPIKACYGTTKYCNAFLKGTVCNNSDCLYLHGEGEAGGCSVLDIFVAFMPCLGTTLCAALGSRARWSRLNAAFSMVVL